MILLIDNYDSFVYNLARYVGELGYTRQVVRNDKITLDEINAINPSHIIISPGPCTPNEAGISLGVVKRFSDHIPILGVCLGHQAIGQAFGGVVTKALKPMHGKSSYISHAGCGMFEGLANPLKVARYHSLVVAHQGLPKEIMITARSEDGEIMALRHKDKPVFGVQFHPESVLTESGYQLLKNFFDKCDSQSQRNRVERPMALDQV